MTAFLDGLHDEYCPANGKIVTSGTCLTRYKGKEARLHEPILHL